jgi:hypothetical protein
MASGEGTTHMGIQHKGKRKKTNKEKTCQKTEQTQEMHVQHQIINNRGEINTRNSYKRLE